jgi:hypothetical protein
MKLLMPGGFGLPSPDTATRKEYVTRILSAAVLEIEEEEEERKEKDCTLQDLFFAP